MRRLNPTQIALIAAAILILAFVIWTVASTRRSNPDKLTVENGVAAKAADPEKRCGSQRTYDLIKRELFRRAAVLRGSDQAAFDRIAAYSVVRVDRPLVEEENGENEAINCSGSLTLDLPPGVAVVGGRRTLTADIGYALQGSADGNGEVLTLTRADAIVTPLATLARIGNSTIDREVSAPSTTDPLEPAPLPPLPSAGPSASTSFPPPPAPAPRPAPPPPPEPRPASPATSSARPSFNCANARTRGEIAVCGDSGLASLDREMASYYVGAMRDADPDTRALLRRSRDRFLTYRDQCPSSACIAQTYRGRIREIRDISSGRLR